MQNKMRHTYKDMHKQNAPAGTTQFDFQLLSPLLSLELEISANNIDIQNINLPDSNSKKGPIRKSAYSLKKKKKAHPYLFWGGMSFQV